jgi:hypothetical protein
VICGTYAQLIVSEKTYAVRNELHIKQGLTVEKLTEAKFSEQITAS